MKVDKLAGGKIFVFRPKGNLTGNDESDALKKAIEEAVLAGNALGLLDMTRVDYVNSAGIGILVGGYNQYKQKSGKLKLFALSDKIENLLVITKLTQVFEVFPNEQEALASFVS